MQTLQSSSTLQGGKYIINKVLGQGGFGITYLAEHSLLGTKVAIKEFFMKEFNSRNEATSQVSIGSEGSRELVEKFKTKFLKEAQNIAKLRHPNIIRIQDVFEENGTAYYVMDYCPCGSLADLIRKNPDGLEEAVAFKYITQIGSALHYIHAQKMNHLDVKPANIILNEYDSAVLIDFGLSKQYDSTGGQTSTTPVGISHGYAPIEQYKDGGVKEFSPQTDIYALGATYYKLLSGQTPPQASDIINEGLPELPERISSAASSAIEKAMEVRKKNRPQTVKEFLSLLNVEIEDYSSIDDENKKKEQAEKERIAEIDNKIFFVQNQIEQIEKDSSILSEKRDSLLNQKREMEAKLSQIDADIDILSKDIESRCKEIEQLQDGIKKLEEEKTPTQSSVGSDSVALSEETLVTSFAIEKEKDDLQFMVYDIPFTMKKVEAGTFLMGATNELDYDYMYDEKPVHRVTISRDFYISETLVVQKLWNAVMQNNPSCYLGDNRPVEQVSMDMCLQFIEKLNSITGKKFRLPKEAEWEYAARGGRKSNNYKFSGNNNIDEVAWYADNSVSTTHDVKLKQPNELGVYDMSGNVWEWCADNYAMYNQHDAIDPLIINESSKKIIRGGSLEELKTKCRVSSRFAVSRSYKSAAIGLRLVCEE